MNTVTGWGEVTAICYFPINLRFATGHSDGNIRYWSAEDGQLLMIINTGAGQPVNALWPEATSLHVWAAMGDSTIRKYYAPSGAPEMIIQTTSVPTSISCIPATPLLFTGHEDGYVRF